MEQKKRFSNKQVRHGGRNKFFDFAMTDEQLDEEEAASKAKKGRG